MANNQKNTKPAKQTTTENEGKKLDATKIFLIVFAAIALIGILTSIVVAIVIGVNKNKSIDYMKTNLKKYVTVSADLYNGYEVTINIPAVADKDIENEIIKVLCQNKITPDGPVTEKTNVVLSAGDIANIYYRGYTKGEDGKKNYFDGGCNFTDSSSYALELGSGSFIPGFEQNLIGKNQNDHASFTKLDSGMITGTEIISLTYSVNQADGFTKLATTVMIDLSDETLDETWGAGFRDYFITNAKKIQIGVDNKFATGKNGDDMLKVDPVNPKEGTSEKQDTYFDMYISEAYRIGEGKVLEVEAYFPTDYQKKELQGETAYFEVYIKGAKDYVTPEYNEAFITDTLKIKAEDLAEYEGTTLIEKYESKIKADLVKTYEDKAKSAIEAKLWEVVLAGANFKKLPEKEVNSIYQSSLSEIVSTYQSGYSNYYSSIDAFARAYLGLGSTADWKATILKDAEDSIKQKLAFYYIVRAEKYIPTDAEYEEFYQAAFDEHLQSYLDYYKITEDSENYEQKLATAKDTIKSQFSDDYWYEIVLYDYAMEKLIQLADVTYA